MLVESIFAGFLEVSFSRSDVVRNTEYIIPLNLDDWNLLVAVFSIHKPFGLKDSFSNFKNSKLH